MHKRLWAFGRFAIVALLLLGTGACASITTGTTQTVTVNTEPSGASCELKRNNITIGIVNPTPGSITIDKSKDHVSVLCDKDAHESAGGTLASELQGMTFGNILFGGLIGVAIDAGSGAMNKYPSSVTLVLPPKSFPTETDRDQFYDGVVARVRQEADVAIKHVRDTCADGTCDDAVKAIETKRDSEIAELNLKRDRAVIRPG